MKMPEMDAEVVQGLEMEEDNLYWEQDCLPPTVTPSSTPTQTQDQRRRAR